MFTCRDTEIYQRRVGKWHGTAADCVTAKKSTTSCRKARRRTLSFVVPERSMLRARELHYKPFSTLLQVSLSLSLSLSLYPSKSNDFGHFVSTASVHLLYPLFAYFTLFPYSFYADSHFFASD